MQLRMDFLDFVCIWAGCTSISMERSALTTGHKTDVTYFHTLTWGHYFICKQALAAKESGPDLLRVLGVAIRREYWPAFHQVRLATTNIYSQLRVHWESVVLQLCSWLWQLWTLLVQGCGSASHALSFQDPYWGSQYPQSRLFCCTEREQEGW